MSKTGKVCVCTKEQKLPASSGRRDAPEANSLEWISDSRATSNLNSRGRCSDESTERKKVGLLRENRNCPSENAEWRITDERETSCQSENENRTDRLTKTRTKRERAELKNQMNLIFLLLALLQRIRC